MTDDQAYEPSEEIFKSICQAIMESERGQWFLAEFTKRNRVADTREILDKLNTMRRVMERQNALLEQELGASVREGDGTVGLIRGQLEEIHTSIQAARQEILTIRPRHGNNPRQLSAATEELDAIVDSTEKATTDILAAAEALQDWAQKLRDMGIGDDVCDEIEAHATNIFMACSFQDITGQRTTKVMHAIRSLDQRVQVMMEMWSGTHAAQSKPLSMTAPDDPRPDAHLLNGPQLDEDGNRQDEIDRMLARDFNELDSLVARQTKKPAGPAPNGVPDAGQTGLDTAQSGDPTAEKEEIDQDDIDALFDENVA